LTETGRTGGDGVTAMPPATRGSDSGTAVAPIRLQTMGDFIVPEMEQKEKIATQIHVQVCVIVSFTLFTFRH